MNFFIQLINSLLTNLFDFLLWPLRSLNPIWALTLVSCLSGLLMVWIFGKVSDQQTIRQVRDRIRGNLLGVRLYQHNIKVVLQLQGAILRDTLTYMKLSILPMLVLIVPVGLILAQLNLRFALRPLEAGHPALIKVKLRDASYLKQDSHLQAPAAVHIETQGVRIEPQSEIAWRISAERLGYYSLKVVADGSEIEKALWVGEGWGAVSPIRTAHSGDLLLYPGEPPIDPPGAIESVEVKYPPLTLSLFGWNVHWLVFFLPVSILFGFLGKRFLGVEL